MRGSPFTKKGLAREARVESTQLLCSNYPKQPAGEIFSKFCSWCALTMPPKKRSTASNKAQAKSTSSSSSNEKTPPASEQTEQPEEERRRRRQGSKAKWSPVFKRIGYFSLIFIIPAILNYAALNQEARMLVPKGTMIPMHALMIFIV